MILKGQLYVNSISNIYLCTFWDADMSMVSQCNGKYQVLLVGYNLLIKYEQLITFYGQRLIDILQDMDIMDLFTKSISSSSLWNVTFTWLY